MKSGKSKKVKEMILDGHAHASGVFLTPESIIDKLDKFGVDKVVLVLPLGVVCDYVELTNSSL